MGVAVGVGVGVAPQAGAVFLHMKARQSLSVKRSQSLIEVTETGRRIIWTAILPAAIGAGGGNFAIPLAIIVKQASSIFTTYLRRARGMVLFLRELDLLSTGIHLRTPLLRP